MNLPAKIEARREQILAAVHRYALSNPRVFGSVARGTNSAESDIDILVDPSPETTLFDLGGLHSDLEDLLNSRVDLVTPRDLPVAFRQQVLQEAIPL